MEETLRLFRSFYARGRTVDELLKLVELESKRASRVGALSGGQKQRLSLACALAGDPDLLFLDEPTTGLDPQSRRQLWTLLEQFRSRGGTILLTTHYLEEAERLCHRLAILDEGRVAAEGTVEHLRALAGEEPTVTIVLARPPGGELSARLAAREALSSDLRSFHLQSAGAERHLLEILALASAEGNEVEELQLHRPNLGDVFLRLTGKALRD